MYIYYINAPMHLIYVLIDHLLLVLFFLSPLLFSLIKC